MMAGVSIETFDAFMARVGLTNIMPAFIDNAYDDMELIRHLDMEDLKELSVDEMYYDCILEAVNHIDDLSWTATTHATAHATAAATAEVLTTHKPWIWCDPDKITMIEWLNHVGHGQTWKIFERHGFEDILLIEDMNESDLNHIGIVGDDAVILAETIREIRNPNFVPKGIKSIQKDNNDAAPTDSSNATLTINATEEVEESNELSLETRRRSAAIAVASAQAITEATARRKAQQQIQLKQKEMEALVEVAAAAEAEASRIAAAAIADAEAAKLAAAVAAAKVKEAQITAASAAAAAEAAKLEAEKDLQFSYNAIEDLELIEDLALDDIQGMGIVGNEATLLEDLALDDIQDMGVFGNEATLLEDLALDDIQDMGVVEDEATSICSATEIVLPVTNCTIPSTPNEVSATKDCMRRDASLPAFFSQDALYDQAEEPRQYDLPRPSSVGTASGGRSNLLETLFYSSVPVDLPKPPKPPIPSLPKCRNSPDRNLSVSSLLSTSPDDYAHLRGGGAPTLPPKGRDLYARLKRCSFPEPRVDHDNNNINNTRRGRYPINRTKMSQWMKEVGLGQYVILFSENGFDDFDIAFHMNSDDLDGLNIPQPEHARILDTLRSIDSNNNQSTSETNNYYQLTRQHASEPMLVRDRPSSMTSITTSITSPSSVQDPFTCGSLPSSVSRLNPQGHGPETLSRSAGDSNYSILRRFPFSEQQKTTESREPTPFYPISPLTSPLSSPTDGSKRHSWSLKGRTKSLLNFSNNNSNSNGKNHEEKEAKKSKHSSRTSGNKKSSKKVDVTDAHDPPPLMLGLSSSVMAAMATRNTNSNVNKTFSDKRTSTYEAVCNNDIVNASSVEAFLSSIGCSRYLNSFLANGYDNIKFISDMDDQDLDFCNVLDPAHRRAIRNALSSIRR